MESLYSDSKYYPIHESQVEIALAMLSHACYLRNLLDSYGSETLGARDYIFIPLISKDLIIYSDLYKIMGITSERDKVFFDINFS